MSTSEKVKLFGMSHLMVERELDRVEERLTLDLGREIGAAASQDDSYYPQFSELVRREAAQMASHYEIFYCLEKSIRDIVCERLEGEHGAAWWDTVVPQNVRENVKKNIQREQESGITIRSTREIDYTTFGELGEVVRSNWQTFSDTFNNDKAFTKVMGSLNLLRGPIAHCSPLAEDEVVRLRLTLKDWFRLME
ncbi:MAG: Swt1 family HEPN domain-containing protein [Thiobacillus sp.]